MTSQDSTPGVSQDGDAVMSEKKVKRPRRHRRPLRLGIAVPILASAITLAMASGVFLGWSALQVASAQSARSKAKVVANVREAAYVLKLAQEATAEAAAAAKIADAQAAAVTKAQQERVYREAGFSPGGEGVYFKFAPTSDYTCGSFDCVYVSVTVSAPCNAGVYVAASKLRGGTSIGFTNAITAGMPALGSASVLLQDTSNSGVTFQVTDAHCMG